MGYRCRQHLSRISLGMHGLSIMEEGLLLMPCSKHHLKGQIQDGRLEEGVLSMGYYGECVCYS